MIKTWQEGFEILAKIVLIRNEKLGCPSKWGLIDCESISECENTSCDDCWRMAIDSLRPEGE